MLITAKIHDAFPLCAVASENIKNYKQMNNRNAIALIVGVLCFFLSLLLIKEKTYYFKLTEIPEVVYVEKTIEYKKIMKEINKYEYEKYHTAKDNLANLRIQESNNYPIALIFMIGGIGIGTLMGGYLENRKN